jgi:hypothetical protein
MGSARGDDSPPTRKRSGYKIVVASKSRVGRIKRAVRRQFILSAGEPILTRAVLERSYPRLRRFTWWHYLAARRALRQEAVVVGRNRYGRGRPNLWAPKRDMAAT